MGHPRTLKKKFESPKRPYDSLGDEKVITREFGLRRKKELWKASTLLRNIRRRARNLQAKKEASGKESLAEERQLIEKINRMGLEAETLDDILKLSVNDFLSRRLQTVAFNKGFGNSIKQARQLIVHGHVMVNGRRAKFPSMIVEKDDENKITLDSSVAKQFIDSPAKLKAEAAKQAPEESAVKDVKEDAPESEAKQDDNEINKGAEKGE